MELKNKLSSYSKILNSNFTLDPNVNNKSNSDNVRVYSNVMYGYVETPMCSYLRNLNALRFNDLKSMLKFNEMNYSSILMDKDTLKMSEIDDTTIFLPNPQRKIRQSITEVIKRRKSCRSFSGIDLTLKDFSTILKYSFGISDRKKILGNKEVYFKYYPSGGGLYPIKPVIYCNKISGIPEGFYEYQPYGHSLLKINVDSYNKEEFFNSNVGINNCNFVVFFEYSINKTYFKYGELSLLNSSIEIGCMLENFDLISNSLGRKTCPVAAFNKNKIESLLRIDGINQVIMFSSICGDEE